MYVIHSLPQSQRLTVVAAQHNGVVRLVEPYARTAGLAQANGKEFLMFETNTASCGGFPGLSDSFGAAL
jgi:hypothetical protein